MINLDPAADDFKYPVSGDVRDLISLSEVMEEMDLGPNGALLYSMEYLEDNLENWLSMTLEGYDDGDCVIFDCPGQIELYSHHSTFRAIADQLQAWSWHVITVYILDAQFVTDGAKYIAGCLQCQAANCRHHAWQAIMLRGQQRLSMPCCNELPPSATA